MTWRALVEERYDDFVMGTRRVLLGRERQDGRMEVLDASQAVWHTVEPGVVSPEPKGLLLPAGAVPALTEALRRCAGDLTHHETEARVLREWLEHERGRVDNLIASFPDRFKNQ